MKPDLAFYLILFTHYILAQKLKNANSLWEGDNAKR